MWRRTYLLLTVFRLFFALYPSYLHPDEHFQGPEFIAGQVFSFPIHKTWEFTSENPIRSVVPLWPIYGWPMIVTRWLSEGIGYAPVKPAVVFWILRVFMFALSFVFEDWAIHELICNPQQRRQALLLVASSYITWTWQTRTFSNAVETVLVAWSLVLIKRITAVKHDPDRRPSFSDGITNHEPHRSGHLAALLLGSLVVCGVFNRITFPAFLILPGLQLLPLLWRRPTVMFLIGVSASMTAAFAIVVDTVFYTADELRVRDMFAKAIICPLNNLLYNSRASNLALHGTHPYYQHAIINLPQMLGPAFALLFFRPRWTLALASAVSGLICLSMFPHQEARFLLPTIPLFLSSIRVPAKFSRAFLIIWIGFNAVLGILMGVFHQGGVVPAQIFLETQPDISTAIWWKTYSPPTWLLGRSNEVTTTVDLMGLSSNLLVERLCSGAESVSEGHKVLIAPRSAIFLDRYSTSRHHDDQVMQLQELWSTSMHLNLDDLDFGDDGVLPTLRRVLGRSGLVIWKIDCKTPSW